MEVMIKIDGESKGRKHNGKKNIIKFVILIILVRSSRTNNGFVKIVMAISSKPEPYCSYHPSLRNFPSFLNEGIIIKNAVNEYSKLDRAVIKPMIFLFSFTIKYNP